MKLHTGDLVQIMVGKDKGKQGAITKVYSLSGKVLIPGLNLYKKHVPKSEQFPTGGIVEIPRALHGSKVQLYCGKCKKPTRVGYEIDGAVKSRVCKKCGAPIARKK
ncbi:MAG: 50S ribosomal protein L24 [Microgenomates bacterium OLB22]|nr:MAG: 50S ribosomal protein L24 [Microgenomates bacterium OLB22]